LCLIKLPSTSKKVNHATIVLHCTYYMIRFFSCNQSISGPHLLDLHGSMQSKRKVM
jgi:hypothetical protein